MVHFPVFDSLEITDYGLYPGADQDNPGLHVKFDPGLTLVIGTNGLGKTTLVTILYRMLTGPFDITGLSYSSSQMGTINLTASELTQHQKSVFSVRVHDAAKNAKATLRFRIAGRVIEVKRNLRDLSLAAFSIDAISQSNEEVEAFQRTIKELSGLSSFGDWIVLLRHITFYFEDRRALVWDKSAQRQLLRLLFLPPELAKQWTDDEREVLSLDSHYRNLRAIVNSQERQLVKNESKTREGTHVRQELQTLEGLQQQEEFALQRLEDQIHELDVDRDNVRQRKLATEVERDACHRALERERLQAIETAFPTRSETARYLIAQIITERECLVCGHEVPSVAEQLARRIDANECVVCGTLLTDDLHPTRLSEADLAQRRNELEIAKRSYDEATEALDLILERQRDYARSASEVRSRLNERTSRMDLLIRQLPPEEEAVHASRNQLAILRQQVEANRQSLSKKREEFHEFVDARRVEIATQSESIKERFFKYAEGFLVEQCQLVWSPQKALVGQEGTAVEFPAFQVDMTGSDYPTPVRRDGPDAVSESQREFIDLAFRMALMDTAGVTGEGTLIIDAPESSLDSIFAIRAAQVLTEFANQSEATRLILTSNLVDGNLLPQLVRRVSSQQTDRNRVVDLLANATPTAAVRKLRSEYEAELNRLLKGIPDAAD